MPTVRDRFFKYLARRVSAAAVRVPEAVMGAGRCQRQSSTVATRLTVRISSRPRLTSKHVFPHSPPLIASRALYDVFPNIADTLRV